MSNEALMFPVSKTIKLGTHKTSKLLAQALDGAGFLVTGVVGAIFVGPWFDKSISPQVREEKICFATAEQITGKASPTVHVIHQSILAKGYKLCSAEVGPQLRLQYSEQPKGEEIWIAMDGIYTVSWGLQIFGVIHGDMPRPGTRAIRAYHSVPGMEVAGSSKWAFVSQE